MARQPIVSGDNPEEQKQRDLSVFHDLKSAAAEAPSMPPPPGAG
jgi:hypothetical protein